MPANVENDGVHVRAFRAGEVRAFDVLFARYERPIFNYLYRMAGSLGAAEDLTQEVFVRVFSALGRGDEIVNFRAWLYRIATNVAISHLRKGDQRVSSLEDALERHVPEPAGGPGDDPERRHVHREEVDEVVAALRRLSDAHRQALVLRQLQGFSYQEMAEAMNLSLEAVTSLLHRARRELRAQLQWFAKGRAANDGRKRNNRGDLP